MLIGALIDVKLDAKFAEFEVRFEAKVRRIIDEKFDEFARVIKKSFDEVFLRLDRIELRLDAVEGRLDKIEPRLDNIEGSLDRIENHDDPEDHPSWK